MENKMFCFQCQETAGCTGCTKFGVCGKSPDLARMQDLLVYTTKGLSEVTTRLRKEGKEISSEINHFITLNLFTTITNANFDDEIFYERVKRVLEIKEDGNRIVEFYYEGIFNEILDRLGNIPLPPYIKEKLILF